MQSPDLSYPVTSVDDAYHACQPEIPLETGDPRYVDLTPIRGGFDIATVVTRCIRRTRRPLFHRQLVTGHRGSGKSTELKHLQASLRAEQYFAVYLDVESVLDLGDITYLDVLLATVRGIYEDLRTENVQIPERLLKNLDEWFAEIVLTEEQRADVQTTLKTEFGVEARVPLVARMLAAITGQIQSGSSRRAEIRKTLRRELRVLIQRLNDLIHDAHVRLTKKGWRDLVVIVDGLEKMHYEVLPDNKSTHSALFVDHAEQLKALGCHVVYTVPISLASNVNLGDAFPDPTLVIPMVKIMEPDGKNPYGPGLNALAQVVAKRVDMSCVFDDAALCHRLVEHSGGSVRDLMRLVRMACYGATDRIALSHIEQSLHSLVLEYDRLVKDEHLGRLAQIALHRQAPWDETTAWLLHHRLVLEYQNERRWFDLHPAVRLNPRVQEAIKG